LRRLRPVNASINAFGAKIFSRRQVGCAGTIVRKKNAASDRSGVEFCRRDKN
jgi:hypothetical protein